MNNFVVGMIWYYIIIAIVSSLLNCSFNSTKKTQSQPKNEIHDNDDDNKIIAGHQDSSTITSHIISTDDDNQTIHPKDDDDNISLPQDDNIIYSNCDYVFSCPSAGCNNEPKISLCGKDSEPICNVCGDNNNCEYTAQNICNCNDPLIFNDNIVINKEKRFDFSNLNCLHEPEWQKNSVYIDGFHCVNDENISGNFYLESQKPNEKVSGPPYAYYNNFFDSNIMGNRFGVEIRFQFYFLNILGNNAFALYQGNLTTDRAINGIDDYLFAKVEYIPKGEERNDALELVFRYHSSFERIRIDLIDSQNNFYNSETNTSEYNNPEVKSQWIIIRFIFDTSESKFYIFIWNDNKDNFIFYSSHTLENYLIPNGLLLGNNITHSESGFSGQDYWSHARIDYIYRFQWRPKCPDE